MKTKLFIAVLPFIFSSCIGQNKENLTTVVVKKNESKKKGEFKNLSKEGAYKLNIGFADKPVWVWAKYDHKLDLNDEIYNHIYGINYWDEDGLLYTMYYESDRDKKNDSIEFSNYILQLYPGDATLRLIGKEGDTIMIFNVLEKEDLRRNFKSKVFKRIPTVNYDKDKVKVSDYDVEISFSLVEPNLYEVTIIDNEGIKDYRYKSNCIIENEPEISYYDLTNNRIYLIKRDCYLEKI